MTMESLFANDPLLGEPGVLLHVLHNLLALCGRAHSTPPSICTFAAVNRLRDASLQPVVVRLPYAIGVERSPRSFTGSTKVPRLVTHCWQITLGHLHGTHMPSPSQPASQPTMPPCLPIPPPRIPANRGQDLSQSTHLACIHSVPQQPAQNRHWSSPKTENVFPAANLESDTPRPRPNNIASRKTVPVSPRESLQFADIYAGARGQAVSLHQLFHKTSTNPCRRTPLILGPSRHHSTQKSRRRCGWISGLGGTPLRVRVPPSQTYQTHSARPLYPSLFLHPKKYPIPPSWLSVPIWDWNWTGTRISTRPKIQSTKVHQGRTLVSPYLVLVPNAHLLQSSSRTTACTSTSLVGLTG